MHELSQHCISVERRFADVSTLPLLMETGCSADSVAAEELLLGNGVKSGTRLQTQRAAKVGAEYFAIGSNLSKHAVHSKSSSFQMPVLKAD